MKDINLVIDILKMYNISSAQYARTIGTTRQNVLNWSYGSGIPKKYLLKTAKILSEVTDSCISIEDILSLNIENYTKSTSKNTTTSNTKEVA